MSNLLKGAFVPISPMKVDESEFFIFDADKIAEQKDRQRKIIRSIEEKAELNNPILNNSFENDVEDFEEKINQETFEEQADETLKKAESIIEEAREEANKIIEQAKAEADTIREQAKCDGYEVGFSEGNTEAMKKVDAYMEDLKREQENSIASEIEILKANYTEDQKQLVDISTKLISKLTGILVDEYEPILIHMINNAITEDDVSNKFVIKVSQDNYLYVSSNIDNITGATNPNISIEVYGDVKLDGRQCIIETDNGIIDLSMDIQVKNLITAMKLLSEN